MKKQKNYKGFTLLEMLVVVLIIGILAGIALPKYQMAVTKAKVASILPIMRRWKDALYEYKLQHGDYCLLDKCRSGIDVNIIETSLPPDWECNNGDCSSEYWNSCFLNEETNGDVYCQHLTNGGYFLIAMYQLDDPNEDLRGKIICNAHGTEGHKVCKALGSKLIDGYNSTYSLN